MIQVKKEGKGRQEVLFSFFFFFEENLSLQSKRAQPRPRKTYPLEPLRTAFTTSFTPLFSAFTFAAFFTACNIKSGKSFRLAQRRKLPSRFLYACQFGQWKFFHFGKESTTPYLENLLCELIVGHRLRDRRNESDYHGHSL